MPVVSDLDAPRRPDETRTVEAAPSVGRRVRWADVAGLLVACLIVVVAFSPILFGGRTLSGAGKGPAGLDGAVPLPGQPQDYSNDFRPDLAASTWQFEPWAEVTNEAYTDGSVPFWNPYQGAGAPLAANMQSAPFDPLLLPVNVHPTPLTWDLTIIAAFIIGAAAMYLFVRVLGLDVVPAVAASAAFSLSGYFFLYSNNLFSRAYIYLPLTFLFVELVVRRRRAWPVLGLAALVAGNVYLGMPEATFCVIGTTVVYAAVRLFHERRDPDVPSLALRLACGFGLGALLAAPILLPFREYEALSINSHKNFGNGQGTWVDPLRGLLNWVVRADYRAPVRNWVGAAVLVSAAVGLCGRRETRRLHGWLFALIGVVALAKIYDVRVLGWVGHLPVFDRVNFPVFFAPVVGFAFAVLAGIGVQVLWRRDLRLGWFLAILGTAALVGVVGLVDALGVPDVARPSIGRVARVAGKAAAFGGLVIAACIAARFLRTRWLGAVAGVAIVAELLAVAPFSLYAKRVDPFVVPAWAATVRETLRDDPAGRVFAVDAKLYPNTSSALKLQDIRALDALYVERYFRFIKTFVQPTAIDRFVGGPYASSETEVARFRNNPMFDLLGVRAIVAAHDLTQDATVPPSPPSPTNVSLRLVGERGDTLVYENVNAYPRAFVVRDVSVVRDEESAFSFLQDRGTVDGMTVIVDKFDPRHQAVVEATGSARSQIERLQRNSTACEASPDRVAVRKYSLNSVILRAHTTCPGLLVLSDTYFPGWSVEVNGRPETVYATDGAFRGVAVPSGSSTVVFHYRPSGWNAGWALALGGLVAFGCVTIWAHRRRARAPTA